MFRSILFLAISFISIPLFAQVEVQVGIGGLFSNFNEIYDGDSPGSAFSSDPSFRPYFSGLAGVAFSEKWNVRARFVGTSRAERNVEAGNGTLTYEAYYVDLGAELQWKPISLLGFSVGPYYAVDLYERIKSGDSSVEPIVELYENYVAIRPAVEVYFGPLCARLDTSFGITPAQRVNYSTVGGQPAGEVSRYWNGASIGLSYRLVKA